VTLGEIEFILEHSKAPRDSALFGEPLNPFNEEFRKMARLVVTAAGSPLFKNFLMIVSVSAADDGKPIGSLKPANFTIAHLASLNHASVLVREVSKVSEGPDGFYTVELKPWEPQPTLPDGHYVFAVAVTAGTKRAPHHGQTVAVGDIPA